MPLLRLDNACLDYGDHILLDHADFLLEPRERVCLIGRNGTGKTTLLKLLNGQAQADSGEIWQQPGLRIATLEQELPAAEDKRIFDIVAEGQAEVRQLCDTYQALSKTTPSTTKLKQLEQLQQQIEARNGWQLEQQVQTLLSNLQLPAERMMRELSGGWRRRVALAKALVNQPDILLLDEPTNHLDIATIAWLEQHIRAFHGSVIFITHDRHFLQALATRIVELDRGHLTSWPGDYQNFLQQKEKFLVDEERHHRAFDKKLAEEETWIRQGIKARRTRNEGRVRALKKLRDIRSQRRTVESQADFKITAAESSGYRVIEAYNIVYYYGTKKIIDKFSIKILRGDRIGLLGNNGAGKTTLLKILLGQLAPQQGKIKHGTHLEIAYFDQLRQTLDLEKSVLENVAQGREFIEVDGKSRHIISYLSDFLFSPQRIRTPVKALSGGERNRLLLAQLFAKPANLLVLDEPTNDLDIETLEILEQRLLDFEGSLLIVSHDRSFLDNVVTSTLAFEGNGKIQEYIGGYQDWLRQSGKLQDFEQIDVTTTEINTSEKSRNKKIAHTSKKLSYKLQRELDNLPDEIEELEQHLHALQKRMQQQDFYAQDKNTIQNLLEELRNTETRLSNTLQRWEELEQLQQ